MSEPDELAGDQVDGDPEQDWQEAHGDSQGWARTARWVSRLVIEGHRVPISSKPEETPRTTA